MATESKGNNLGQAKRKKDAQFKQPVMKVEANDLAVFNQSSLHEAAHAVIGIHLGLPIVSTNIESTYSSVEDRTTGGNTIFDDEEIERRGLWKETVVCIFAGEAAERRAGLNVRDGGDDRDAAQQIARERLGIATEHLALALRDCEHRAELLLNDRGIWETVLRVATKLLSTKKLSSEQLMYLIFSEAAN